MGDDARMTVDGIGGLLFSSPDPERLTEWYDARLGVLPPPSSYGGRVWRPEAVPPWLPSFRASRTRITPAR